MSAFDVPHSSAAAVVAVDDDRAARSGEVRARLAFIATGIATGLVVVTCGVGGAIASAHRTDHALWSRWWAHHTAYDCCARADERCAPGVQALRELQDRLNARAPVGGVEAVLARVFAVDSLAVTEAPTDRASVARIVESCPVVATR